MTQGWQAFDSRPAAWLAIGCVPAMAVFAFIGTSVADIATGILVLLGTARLISDRGAYRNAAVLLSFGWIFFVVFSAFYATQLQLPGNHFRSIAKQVPIAYGPLIAIALVFACDRLRLCVDTLLVLLLSSLVIGATILLLNNGGLSRIAAGWSADPNADLGRLNRNYAGFVCGLAIIAAVSLVSHVFAVWGARAIRSWAIAVLLGIIALTFAVLIGLLEGRTAYLATVLGLSVWLVFVLGSMLVRQQSRRRKLAVLISLLGIVLMVAAAPALFEAISHRGAILKGNVSEYAELASALLHGKLDQTVAGMSNVEVRLQLATVGLDLVQQRPLLGWGPDIGHLIAAHSPVPGVNFNHFHNGYLQTVVSFGAVGTGLLLALLGSIAFAAVQARRAKGERIAHPLFAATLALITYIAVFNFTETILFVKPAAIVCVLVIAIACFRLDASARPNPADTMTVNEMHMSENSRAS